MSGFPRCNLTTIIKRTFHIHKMGTSSAVLCIWAEGTFTSAQQNVLFTHYHKTISYSINIQKCSKSFNLTDQIPLSLRESYRNIVVFYLITKPQTSWKQTLILLSEIISKQTEVCLNYSNLSRPFISLVGREISDVTEPF